MMHGMDRAIVMGLGKHGASVAAAARERWATRPSAGQRVAWVAASTPDDALRGLPGAVSAISRLRSDALLTGGRANSGAGVVRVLVVCALADEMADEVCAVARAVRRAVEGVADARVVGMAILPGDGTTGGVPATGTREHLRNWLAVGNLHDARTFDGGCLCLGAANHLGFTLSEAERDALGAEMVVQWLGGPLDDTHWQTPVTASALTSAGIAAWVYPVERLQTWVGDEMAAYLLDTWLEPTANATLAMPDQGADLITRFGLSRQSLGEEAAPASFFGDLNIPADTPTFLFGGQGNDGAVLEAEYHARLEALTERRDLLDKNVGALTARVVAEVVNVTAAALDEPTPGRVHAARDRLAALLATLDGLKKEAGASAARRFETIGHLDAEREELTSQMSVLAERLPRSQTAALGLLFRPWRLWRAYQAARAMRSLAGSVAALLQQCLALTVEIVRDDQCQEIYAGAAEAVATLEADVLRLADRLAQARAQIEPAEDGLCGVLGFPTECSLLTPEIIAELIEPLWQDTGFVLREAATRGLRLSRWLNNPPLAATIAARCVAFGRERGADLSGLTAEELFTRRFPATADRGDAVQSMLAAAAPFLRWDEAQVSGPTSGQAGVSRWLGLAQGESSLLLAEIASRIGKVRAMGTQDETRITAVQIVQGVGVDALILDEEVDDGFEADVDVAVV